MYDDSSSVVHYFVRNMYYSYAPLAGMPFCIAIFINHCIAIVYCIATTLPMHCHWLCTTHLNQINRIKIIIGKNTNITFSTNSHGKRLKRTKFSYLFWPFLQPDKFISSWNRSPVASHGCFSYKSRNIVAKKHAACQILFGRETLARAKIKIEERRCWGKSIGDSYKDHRRALKGTIEKGGGEQRQQG